MSFTSMSIIMLAMLFILPGAVVLRVANRLYPFFETSTTESLLLSLLYGSIIGFLVTMLFSRHFPNEVSMIIKGSIEQDAVSLDITSFLIVLILMSGAALVSAVGIGVLVAKMRQKHLVEKLLRYVFRFNISAEVDSWNCLFGRILEDSVVLSVKLKDGTTVVGRYGEESNAGTSPTDSKDLFLEDVLYIQDGEKKRQPKNNLGMYISPNEICTITLFKEARYSKSVSNT